MRLFLLQYSIRANIPVNRFYALVEGKDFNDAKQRLINDVGPRFDDAHINHGAYDVVDCTVLANTPLLPDNPKYIRVKSHNCLFSPYGPEERQCRKCNYTIGGSGDINNQLEMMINSGHPIPSCGIN